MSTMTMRTRAGPLVGTSGNAVLQGTSGPDAIVGLGSDDVIHGNGGNAAGFPSP